MTAPGGAYAPTQLPPDAQGKARDLFFTQVDFANVAIGLVPSVLPVNVDADAGLVFTGGAFRVTTVADRTAALPDPAVFIAFRRSGAGRDLQSAAMPIAAVLGSGQRPARWETPLLVVPNSTLQVTVTSAHGAAVFVQVTLWGYKLFQRSAQF